MPNTYVSIWSVRRVLSERVMNSVVQEPTLLMLAGLPGTGKSTLAHALAAQLYWPLLDKDVVNAVLLSRELEQSQAGPMAYEVVFALAHSFVVKQQQSLILDTAGRFPRILEQAQSITGEAKGRLKVIRLIAPQALRRTRLAQRDAGPSQWSRDDITIAQEAAWYAHLPPDTLVMNSDQPVEDLIAPALTYILS